MASASGVGEVGFLGMTGHWRRWFAFVLEVTCIFIESVCVPALIWGLFLLWSTFNMLSWQTYPLLRLPILPPRLLHSTIRAYFLSTYTLWITSSIHHQETISLPSPLPPPPPPRSTSMFRIILSGKVLRWGRWSRFTVQQKRWLLTHSQSLWQGTGIGACLEKWDCNRRRISTIARGIEMRWSDSCIRSRSKSGERPRSQHELSSTDFVIAIRNHGFEIED